MRKFKRMIAALAAMTMVFGAVNIMAYAENNSADGKTMLTAEKSNSRTATISVIDEETGELIDQDMGFDLLGSPVNNKGEGIGGVIFVGSWDSSKNNPYTFEELPECLAFYITYTSITHEGKVTHDGEEYDAYSYEVDDQKSERQFEVTDGVPKDVKIYAKKKYYKYAKEQETNAVPTLKGDADLNGVVELADLITVAKYSLSHEAYPLANDTAFANADMNGDGVVDGLDVSALIENQLGRERKTVEIPVSGKTVELTADLVTETSIQASRPGEKFENSQVDFAVGLLKNTAEENKNTLISPYSAAQALAMTANGAQKNTLKELMNVIGGGMDIDSFNSEMRGFISGQPNMPYCRMHTANSIWYHNDAERFTPYEEFLKTNKSFYDAQIFSAPMNDETVNDVNSWVSEHTDKMIPEIIKEFAPDTIMALVNAVTFEAKWKTPYENCPKKEDFFTSADGKKQDAVLLAEEDDMPYFKDDEATGFMKYYQGEKFAFAAILPNEGISADEYVKGLTAEKLSSLLGSAEENYVSTKMPKFTADYTKTLNDALNTMGVKDAFDINTADFSKMGKAFQDVMYINTVLQKTHIDVDSCGTKAAAATIVEMNGVGCPAPDPREPESVILDRPFVYAIVDTQTNIPIFIGTLNTLE